MCLNATQGKYGPLTLGRLLMHLLFYSDIFFNATYISQRAHVRLMGMLAPHDNLIDLKAITTSHGQPPSKHKTFTTFKFSQRCILVAVRQYCSATF